MITLNKLFNIFIYFFKEHFEVLKKHNYLSLYYAFFMIKLARFELKIITVICQKFNTS